VPAATHDDHVIGGLRLRATPVADPIGRHVAGSLSADAAVVKRRRRRATAAGPSEPG
jgi:hypothetical protein